MDVPNFGEPHASRQDDSNGIKIIKIEVKTSLVELAEVCRKVAGKVAGKISPPEKLPEKKTPRQQMSHRYVSSRVSSVGPIVPHQQPSQLTSAEYSICYDRIFLQKITEYSFTVTE
ncbi:hypothetical protein Acr_10g0004100 [Actinidia rufa]|uniref:Uncharacterized protein n=1 Tax=Actinidia rufa TaxID=165716 RepID=A0A7J0F8L3_9ERIC|nr:hypothetical protein Acr_10g0004100 [Actinidia rufa]